MAVRAQERSDRSEPGSGRGAKGSAEGLSPQWRQFGSLAIVLHLLLVFVALSANYAPSALQQRLLDVFAVYTRALNLDPNFTPYHLTHATEVDVDHQVQVLLENGDASNPADWVSVPNVHEELTISEPYRRRQRFAKVLSLFADDDATAGHLARGMASQFVHQRDLQPTRVRARAHLLQSWTDVRAGSVPQRDPFDPSYYDVRYDARILIGPAGSIDVLKTATAGEVARPDASEP